MRRRFKSFDFAIEMYKNYATIGITDFNIFKFEELNNHEFGDPYLSPFLHFSIPCQSSYENKKKSWKFPAISNITINSTSTRTRKNLTNTNLDLSLCQGFDSYIYIRHASKFCTNIPKLMFNCIPWEIHNVETDRWILYRLMIWVLYPLSFIFMSALMH